MKTANKPEVTYAETRTKVRAKQQDAAWYVDGYGHTWAATVTLNGNEIHIYADGEMRIHSYPLDRDLREAGDLLDAGLNTDADLARAQRAGKIEWINNAWFDLYNADEHLDCVCDTLNDAVKQAIQLLTAGDNQ